MFWLVLYRFAVSNAVAFVNVLTHTMLSWSIVAQGLHRTVLVMFGGSVILGAGGAFLALLGLVALVFAVCLFALKVLLLMVLAVLFVAGPLLIALTPLPTVGYLARGWLLALVGICLIPVGWCIIFATAGAISLDVTNLGGGAHIGSRVVGAFAALATFYIALKWPLMVLGHVRGSLGGLGVRPGAPSAGGSVVSDGALAAKAQRARTGLQAAMLAGGRGIGLAAGALGAPARRTGRSGSTTEHDHILRVPPRAVRLPSGRLEPDLARPPLRGASPRRGMPSATRRRGCVTRGGPPASRPPRGAPRERKPDRDGARAAGGQAGAHETGQAAAVNPAPDGAARPRLAAPGPRARATQGARRSCRQAPSRRVKAPAAASPSQRKRRPRTSQICSRSGQRNGPTARR